MKKLQSRDWPNGLGRTTRVGSFDVNHYHTHAAAERFRLPDGATQTFTTDRRWNGWPIFVVRTVIS